MRKTPIALAIAYAISFAPLAMAQGASAGSSPPSGSSDQSFLRLDSDLDGKITQQEAQNSQMLKDQFSQADANQDGGIDASEFSAFVATSDQSGQMGEGQMSGSGGQVSFDMLDMDKDGKVSQDEAQAHPTLSQQYTTADQDQDGSISQSEFSAFEAQQGGQMGGSSGQVSFDTLDVDKDGKLSQSEAQVHPTLSQQYTTADQDQDGSISQSEFSAFEAQQGGQSGQMGGSSGRMSFDMLDMDKDGKLSQSEAQVHPSLSQQYTSADQDQDGSISQAEFSAFEAKQGGQSSGGATGGQAMSFDQLDINKDGYLSAAEVKGQPQITQQYTTIDTNKDGWISKQEYQAKMGTGGQAQGQAQGTSSFQSLDTNRDGVISQNEASTDPTLSKQFTQIDRDGNGFISQAEFSAFETAKQQGGGGSMPQQ